MSDSERITPMGPSATSSCRAGIAEPSQGRHAGSRARRRDRLAIAEQWAELARELPVSTGWTIGR
jgi:hypothetical protein